MYKIDIEKKCSCFKKRFKEELPIKVEDEAKAYLMALEFANKMNSSFCDKHRFYVKKKDDKFIIKVD